MVMYFIKGVGVAVSKALRSESSNPAGVDNYLLFTLDSSRRSTRSLYKVGAFN